MNNDIKAIILDVDGVIVGEKVGYNSPHPHPEVTTVLKTIQNQGIPISLCTAKPHFAIRQEIKDADLDNLHITDGGGVIIDPLHNRIVKKNIISKSIAKKVLAALINHQVYTEFYTVDDYFIQASQAGDITTKHEHVIQASPQRLSSVVSESTNYQITKIMPIASDETDKNRVQNILEPFLDKLVVSWGVHPVVLPLQFGIITAPGISKKQGAIEISQALNIDFKHILGVGDSPSDWQFIGLCGYAAAMSNAKPELKDLVTSKDKGKYFVGPSVDQNGIIDIFKYFKLL